MIQIVKRDKGDRAEDKLVLLITINKREIISMLLFYDVFGAHIY